MLPGCYQQAPHPGRGKNCFITDRDAAYVSIVRPSSGAGGSGRRSPSVTSGLPEHPLEARWGPPGGPLPPGVQAPSRERWSHSNCRSPSSVRTRGRDRGRQSVLKAMRGWVGAGRERHGAEDDRVVTAGGCAGGCWEPMRSLMEARGRGGEEVLPAGTGAKAHPGRSAAPETRGRRAPLAAPAAAGSPRQAVWGARPGWPAVGASFGRGHRCAAHTRWFRLRSTRHV